MNAIAPIVAAPFDLDAAHMEAHRWVETARPLIVAYLALDMVQADLLAAAHEAHQHYAGDIRFAASNRIAATMNGFLTDIEHIRDTWIGDLSPPPPNRGVWATVSQADLDAYDDLCEIWEERIRDVLSVDAAIHQIGGAL